MIKELCRLCGVERDNMWGIFDECNRVKNINFKIHQVLHINIETEDILPTKICTECTNQLENAFYFISLCNETQTHLKKLYETHLVKQSDINTKPEVSNVPAENDDTTFETKFSESTTTNATTVIQINFNILECDTLPKHVENNSDIQRTDNIPGYKQDSADENCSENDENKKLCQLKNVVINSMEGIKHDENNDDGTYYSDSEEEDLFKDDVDDDSDYHYCTPNKKKVSPKKRKLNKFQPKTTNSIAGVKHKKKSRIITNANKMSSQENAIPKETNNHSQSHKELKEKKRLTCVTCEMTFAQELMYEEHLNVHTGNRPFSCKLCKASFRKRQELNQHLRTVHSEKQFKCPLCEHVAKHKGKLTEHMKSVHEKPFACDLCNYRTGEKGKIMQHIANKHTFDLSYICEICGNGFKTKNSLQTHRQNIHFPEPKVCQTCGTVCPSLARYSAHIFRCGKEKKRYPCEKCGQTYVNKEILKDHMNKHLNIRPYKCDICGKQFFQRNRLDTHKYVHRGPMYRCEVCSQSFNRKDNMKNHMKKHFYKSMRYNNMIVTAV